MATLEDNLEKLEAVLQKDFPSAYVLLNERLMNDEIHLLEKKHKISLPATLRPLYRWHNGQQEKTYPVFFFGTFFSLENSLELIRAAREGRYHLPEGFFPIAGDLSPAVVLTGLDRDGYFNQHPGEIVEIDFDCYTSTALAPDTVALTHQIAEIYQNGAKDKRKLHFPAGNKRKPLNF